MGVSTVFMPYSTLLGFTEAKTVIPDLQVEIFTLKQGFSQHLKDVILKNTNESKGRMKDKKLDFKIFHRGTSRLNYNKLNNK